MMKYTMLGFWIGLCAFISLNYLIKKQYKKLITWTAPLRVDINKKAVW